MPSSWKSSSGRINITLTRYPVCWLTKRRKSKLSGERLSLGGGGLRHGGALSLHAIRFSGSIAYACSSRILCAVPFSAVAKSATVAPKVEVYTMLACRVHKPDIFHSMAGHDAVLMPNLLRSEHAYSAIPWASNMVSQSNSSSQASTLFVQVEKRDRKPANPCAADPVVQAAVARLSAGEYCGSSLFHFQSLHEHMTQFTLYLSSWDSNTACKRH